MTVFNGDRFLLQRQLKARAKKAIEQLQLRTLKPGDKVWPMLEFPERYGTPSAQHPEWSIALEQDAEIPLSL